MSLLAAMKQKKKERLTVKHPLYQRDISMRYAYVMGVALVLATGGGISETGRVVLEKLVYAIGLPEDTLEKVIATAESAAAESIDTVVDTVLEKEEQYCLLLEMHLAALRSGAEQQREQRELIGGFGELMLLSAEEDGFLRNFAQTALEKNTSMATEVLTEGYENQLEPNFEVLKYFLPTLDYREEIEGFTLEAGQSRSITRPCIVKGPIVVKEGALLSIQGIEMILGQGGKITIKGGQLQLTNSQLIAGDGCESIMLTVFDVPRLIIDDVKFDGMKKAQALSIHGGTLEVRRCVFLKCNGGALQMSASTVQCLQTEFLECQSTFEGGAVYGEKGIVNFSRCIFQNCSSENGGAVYLIECTFDISESTFIECEAKKDGGAIWWGKGKGEVNQCSFEKCAAGGCGGGIAAFVFDHDAGNCQKSKFFKCVAGTESSGAIEADYFSFLMHLDVENCEILECTPDGEKHVITFGLWLDEPKRRKN